MKKVSLFIFSVMCFMCSSLIVDAGSFSLTSSKSTVTAGESYTIYVKYSGEILGSAKFNIEYKNTNCSATPKFSTITSNCNASVCEVKLDHRMVPDLVDENGKPREGYFSGNEVGKTSGLVLYTLSCKSNSAGTSKFTVALYNGDAWDVDGLNEISVSSASTSVNVVAATTTTTTKATTATTTSRQVVTTKPTSKTTTSKTTTVASNTKPVSTTVPKNDEEETTEVVNSDSQELTTTTPTMTTSTTTTQESALVVPDDLKLNKLQIVGYNFNFKPNQTSYKIKVAKDVNELYVIAEPIDSNTRVTNLGIINIEDKDYFIIKVYNELTFHSIEYKIIIDRTVDVVSSINNTVVILAILVIVAISAVLLSIFKKGKAKLEKVDNVVIDPIKTSAGNGNKFIDDEFVTKDGNNESNELTTIKNIKDKND